MSVIDHVRTPRLRRRWLFVGGGSVVSLVVGSSAVAGALGSRAALAWAAVVSPLLGWEAWFFHSRREEPTLAAIRAGNAVTLLRGWLYAAVGGFVVLQPAAAVAWAPSVCYGVGAALDQVDGRLARHTSSESDLGRHLDMAIDTLGFVVAPAVAVVWGRLPVWYLLLTAARHLFRLGRGLRRRRDRPVHELAPNALRRNLSGLQMAFLAVALLPVVPTGVVTPAAAALLAPFLAMFVRDYLVVAGHYPATETDR